jgi:hypothetical protein
MQIYAGKCSLVQDPWRNEEPKRDGDNQIDLWNVCVRIFRWLTMSVGYHLVTQDGLTSHPVKVLIWCTGRARLLATSLISASRIKLQLLPLLSVGLVTYGAGLLSALFHKVCLLDRRHQLMRCYSIGAELPHATP